MQSEMQAVTVGKVTFTVVIEQRGTNTFHWAVYAEGRRAEGYYNTLTLRGARREAKRACRDEARRLLGLFHKERWTYTAEVDL